MSFQRFATNNNLSKKYLRSYVKTLGLESEPFLKQYFLKKILLRKKYSSK